MMRHMVPNKPFGRPAIHQSGANHRATVLGDEFRELVLNATIRGRRAGNSCLT